MNGESPLLRPIAVGTVTLAHRPLVLPHSGNGRTLLCTEEGQPSRWCSREDRPSRRRRPGPAASGNRLLSAFGFGWIVAARLAGTPADLLGMS